MNIRPATPRDYADIHIRAKAVVGVAAGVFTMAVQNCDQAIPVLFIQGSEDASVVKQISLTDCADGTQVIWDWFKSSSEFRVKGKRKAFLPQSHREAAHRHRGHIEKDGKEYREYDKNSLGR